MVELGVCGRAVLKAGPCLPTTVTTCGSPSGRSVSTTMQRREEESRSTSHSLPSEPSVMETVAANLAWAIFPWRRPDSPVPPYSCRTSV